MHRLMSSDFLKGEIHTRTRLCAYISQKVGNYFAVCPSHIYAIQYHKAS